MEYLQECLHILFPGFMQNIQQDYLHSSGILASLLSEILAGIPPSTPLKDFSRNPFKVFKNILLEFPRILPPRVSSGIHLRFLQEIPSLEIRLKISSKILSETFLTNLPWIPSEISSEISSEKHPVTLLIFKWFL